MPQIRTSDGVAIHYESEGAEEAPALLFSNSLGTNLAMWDGQMGEAAYRGFRTIRYDQRGHGQSEAPAGPYTMERLANDAIDLLDALGIEKAAFCGLSMGGMTGLWLAREQPRRISRLAACNTAVWFQAKEVWEGRIKTIGERGMEGVADGVVERWFTKGFRDRAPDEVARVKEMILTTDPTGYSGCAAAIRDMDIRDRLGLIEAPALVVIGAQDPATTPEQGRYIVERVPGAQKVVLDTAHLSNIEDRDGFNAAVFAFLAGERL